MKNVRSTAKPVFSATYGIATESTANITCSECEVSAGAFECSEMQMAQGRELQAIWASE